MLKDDEIVAELEQHPDLIQDLKYDPTDPLRPPTAIQASSVDLTIGNIFLPEREAGEGGGIDRPRQRVSLRPGHTAVVETFETIKFPADLAGFGFPPARVSKQGLLMTNPGHVDPGYKGKLRFTVINMAKDEYLLQPRDKIVTLLLFKLSGNAQRPYSEGSSTITSDLLQTLSEDFVDVEKRAEGVAKGVANTGRWVTVGVAVIAFLGSIYTGWLANRADINGLKRDLKSVQEQLVNKDISNQLADLEEEVEEIRQRTQ